MQKYKVYNIVDEGKYESYDAVMFESESDADARIKAKELSENGFYNLEKLKGEVKLYRQTSENSWLLVSHPRT